MLAGCYYDQRKDIAYETLFSAKGWPDAQAFSQALAVKFPPGSPVSSLQAFVAKFGGSCNARSRETLSCTIPTRGTFCAASMLMLNVAIEAGNLQSIKVVATGAGC